MNGTTGSDFVAGGGLGVGVSIDVESIAPLRTGFVRFFGFGQLVYSVKFLCGTILPDLTPNQFPSPEPANQYLLVPGAYLTAVNIHNPHRSRVTFRKQAVIVNPQRKPRGKIGTSVTETLGPNEGVEVDCEDIKKLLGVQTLLLNDFIQGFVVITTSRLLAVTAVYTLERISAAGQIVEVP